VRFGPHRPSFSSARNGYRSTEQPRGAREFGRCILPDPARQRTCRAAADGPNRVFLDAPTLTAYFFDYNSVEYSAGGSSPRREEVMKSNLQVSLAILAGVGIVRWRFSESSTLKASRRLFCWRDRDFRIRMLRQGVFTPRHGRHQSKWGPICAGGKATHWKESRPKTRIAVIALRTALGKDSGLGAFERVQGDPEDRRQVREISSYAIDGCAAVRPAAGRSAGLTAPTP